MHFAGVDLAWAGRNPTGVAVVDDDGVLASVCAVRDDADVLAALAPYVQGDCLVGFDAPLVVTNPTGQRPAEAALNRDFRKYEAGAHPANTGKPEFADGPRAARLAHALNLEVRPAVSRAATRHRGLPARGDGGAVSAGAHAEVQGQTRPRRRAAQVGAAAADGRRRDARARRSAATCHRPRGWESLRCQVSAAQRKSELRRAEDPVDAVVCAYVALYAAAPTRPRSPSTATRPPATS